MCRQFISDTSLNLGNPSKPLTGLFTPAAVLSAPCRYAYRTRRRNLGNTSASSAAHRRFFVPTAIVAMAAGIGTPYGVPVPLFRFSTANVSRHPISVETDGDGFQTNKESEMSVTTPSGEFRPNSPIPTCEVLQGLLVELEAAADLVERLLIRGHDPAIIATLIAGLTEMTDLLKGGRV